MKFINNSLEGFNDEMASGKPTPGGGSAAAYAGSMAASLLVMVGNLTDTERSSAIIIESKTIGQRLEQLVDEDSDAFKEFLKAPAAEKDSALQKAALVPLETATICDRVLDMAGEMVRDCKKSVITDAGTAAALAGAAVQSACFNVVINLNSIKDVHFQEATQARLKDFENLDEKRTAIIDYVKKRLES